MPVKKISAENVALKVLVVGGSLGAKVLNDLLPEVFSSFSDAELNVIHQSGKGHYQTLQKSYQQLHVTANVQEFIADMASAYDWADLIICRAGALTVAELAVVGLPAIFVPLPHAADDHQTKNAQYLVDQEAAVLITQKELTAKKLSDYLRIFLQNRKLLTAMSQKSRKVAIIDATERVASICNQLVRATRN
ncbi:hypothetical protein MUP77_23270 [Candidatus Bathyarchaeota archaeon]|nr:hypothetical protein [Candidatus Bathyarchaeota archaeon]